MSLAACTEFLDKINSDAGLQQETTTVLEGKEEIEEAANAFVLFGAKHGYEFTAAEAIQKYQEVMAQAEGELDDEVLEQVAGGRRSSGTGCCFASF
ncbi:MAG: Nif11 family protein [Nostoc sp. DedSLP03]|uniref:Nif11 family protein n=1 Tax=Nostoc sp. DedSLP03 TaxID=3075400 RepID=UPI002AD57D38|nr:Nif11 family protein [Nostoc sp. DedSLP03]MDZ7968077.1 Nif11 family protein [Nostoc sp. DedSLP03]